MDRSGFAVSMLLGASLFACSAPTRPVADSADVDVDVTGQGEPNVVTPTDELCDTEAATRICRTSIATDRGFVLCADGEQTCRDARWSDCTTTATSAGFDRWAPVAKGCNAPAEPCTAEGKERECKQNLPADPGRFNCYRGHQRCAGGFWSSCVEDDTNASTEP